MSLFYSLYREVQTWGNFSRAVFLIGLSELRDEGTDGLGLKEHPGADADAFDLTVMEPSPEGRTGDPQGSQGLLYGEQSLQFRGGIRVHEPQDNNSQDGRRQEIWVV